MLSEGLIKTKRMMIEFIMESIDSCFSHQVLQNRESAREAMKLVLDTLEQHVSTKEANNLLNKLHSGELEIEHQEMKIKALVEFFNVHLKTFMDPLSAQVSRYLQKFYHDMEGVKEQIKSEHFTINKYNMQVQKPQFKIRITDLNHNEQLKISEPKTVQLIKATPHYHFSESKQKDTEAMGDSFKRLQPSRVSKSQKQMLLKSLDFTARKTYGSVKTQQQNSTQNIVPSTPMSPKIQQQIESTECIREPALFETNQQQGTELRPLLRRLSGCSTQHINLFNVLSIQKQICISAGKEGNLNLFSLHIEVNDLQGNSYQSIKIQNEYSIKPHQELKFVELCQTPGMFMTAGRNFKNLNDKFIDLGFIIKLYLFQDIRCIDQLSEFRDLHSNGLDQIKFVGEQYLRQRFDNVKFSNELLFGTAVAADSVKLWRFQFDSSKTYNGELQNVVKIDLASDSMVRGIDFQNNLIMVSDINELLIYQVDEDYGLMAHENKQIKMTNNSKDSIVRSKGISGYREMAFTSQGLVYIVELKRIGKLGQVHSVENKNMIQTLASMNSVGKQQKGNDQTIIKTYVKNIKKHLRNIITDKEDKEIELVDVIEVDEKQFIAAFKSPLYNHFLALNRNMDICDGKFRIQATNIHKVVYVEQENKQGVMITLENKNELGLWELKVK